MNTCALAIGAPAWSRTLPSILPVEPCARSDPAPKPRATAASANDRAARAKALTQLCFMETSSKGVDLHVQQLSEGANAPRDPKALVRNAPTWDECLHGDGDDVSTTLNSRNCVARPRPGRAGA